MHARTRRCGAILVVSLLFPAASFAASDLRLVEAAKRNDRAAVQALLNQGADVNTPYADGATALHWAAHWDDLPIAELLIRARANVNAANELGVTPLMLACTNGSPAMAEMLLKAGADPNVGPAGRETPVMTAARTGNVEVIKVLLDHGGDVNAKEASRGQTALMWAASEKHRDVVQLLVQRGADLHARTRVAPPPKPIGYEEERRARQAQQAGAAVGRPRIAPDAANGFTPLLFAARLGDVDSGRILLDAGANPNDAAEDGLSALVLATVRGHPEFAMMLLERGADPNADGAGYTALHWAAGSWESELTTRAITTERVGGEWYTIAGLKEGRLDLVKALLEHGADANARLRSAPLRAGSSRNPPLPEVVGATPYLLAAMAGETDVMRLLAAAGADVRLGTKARGTPLMAAAGLGRVPGEVIVPQRDTLAAAQLAVELGADVNASDDVGNTALHYAAFLRRDSIIQFLADKGARLDVKNKYDETPLWAAELVMQFSGGGTFQVLRSSTSDLLRKLGARTFAPPYEHSRPTEWPDIPRNAADQVRAPNSPERAPETPGNTPPGRR